MTEQEREKKRQYNLMRDARKKVDRLIELRGNACHWCRRPLVLIKTIPPWRRLRKSATTIWWFDEAGAEHSGLILTIDHIIPRSRGGRSRLDNMVVSCFTCNQARGPA